MLLSIKEMVSSFNFILEPCCPAPCEKCDPINGIDQDHLLTLLKENMFFHYNPKKSVYNIIGRDPLNHPYIVPLVKYLKNHNIKVRLWTFGFNNEKNIQKLRKYVDQIQLLFVANDESVHAEITGEGTYKRILKNIDYLRSFNFDVVLNVPVLPMNIQWLPEIYELTFQKNISALFHYHPSDFIDRDAIPSINRFKLIKNLFVVKRHQAQRIFLLCRSIPIQEMSDTRTKSVLFWQKFRKKTFYFR